MVPEPRSYSVSSRSVRGADAINGGASCGRGRGGHGDHGLRPHPDRNRRAAEGSARRPSRRSDYPACAPLCPRRFGVFTGELDKLVEWLQSCGVKTVAMESTGVYWIPPYQKLEAGGLVVVLANARHLRQVPGRKTDVKDCQWLQRLHSYGMLQGSFRPAEEYCRLRSLMRHRENLVAGCVQQVQYMQKALDLMNVRLHQVVSDLNGETGLRILDAILAGERDPKKLTSLRDERIKRSTPPEMEAALQGDWREEQLFILQQARETYRFVETQLARCDAQIEKVLQQIVVVAPRGPSLEPPPNPTAAPTPRKKKERGPHKT